MKNLKLNTSKKILSLLLGANITLLSGCNHTVVCEVTTPHAHAYVREDGLTRYVQSEKKYYRNFDRTDDYINLEESEQDLNEFEVKKRLIRIDKNMDQLLEFASKNPDGYIYEYTYKLYESHRTGVHCYYTWEDMVDWTGTPNNIEICGEYKELRLTGNIKVLHYTYPTYKVIINEKGKYEIIDGPILDNIEDRTEEYPYLRLDFRSTNYTSVVCLDVDEATRKELNQAVVKQLRVE